MTVPTVDSEGGSQLTAFKDRQRATWSAGDYPAVATHIAAVGRELVDRMAVAPGERVIDVACGAGNAAIPAAEAGGRVVGIDLTPELFAAGRRAAGEAGGEVDWREGDAEALP
ncbi:MAG: class I SAM-dependent methyltransferase, partial [Actinomycetes bacterium]